MNVLTHELKSYRKGLLFWSIGMIALVYSGMAKYSAYKTTGQSIGKLMDQFPHAVQIIFGLVGFDLSKMSGFYGVMFLYFALMVAVHAVLLGTDIISKEERDKTSEFLFVKPLSRARIITSKLLSGLIILIVLNLVTGLSSFAVVTSIDKTQPITGYIVHLMIALFCLQLIYFTLGTAVASLSRKPKTSGVTATSILLATFILSYIIDFAPRLDFLKFLSPFQYFSASQILNTGSLQAWSIILSLVITVAFVGITYASYVRRDLEV